MTLSNQRKIGKQPQKEQVTLTDTLHDTWRVMKPFVHFSIKVVKVVGAALIFIVKHIPKPEENQPKSKNGKVIKI